MKSLYNLLILLLFTASPLISGNLFQPDAEDSSFKLKIDQIQKLITSGEYFSFDETIKLEEKAYKFSIEKSNFSHSNTIFKTNHTNEFKVPEGFYLKGEIRGDNASTLSISIIGDKVFGFVEVDSKAYVLHKIADNNYIFSYVDKEKSPLEDYCKNGLLEENLLFEEELLKLYRQFDNRKKADNKVHKLASRRTVRVALECDNELFQLLNQDSIMIAQYALGLWSSVNTIYVRDANVQIAVPYFNLWTKTDPYTGFTPEVILNQFKSYWVTNNPYDDRSVASILSGHIGHGGLAWVGKLCNKFFGYSFMSLYGTYSYPSLDYYWDLHVTTHELGHNIGLVHTHNCNWNPPIDSCYEAESGDCFTQTVPTTGTIMSYCHNIAGGSVDLHFHDRCVPIIQASVNQALCTPMINTPSLSIKKSYLTCSNTGVMIGGEASGGTPPYSYEWISGSYISIHDTNFTFVNPKQTDDYILRVRDANNFEAFDTTLVKVTQAPEAIISGDLEICEDHFYSFSTPYDDEYVYQWEYGEANNRYPDTSNYVELKWSEPGEKIIKVIVSQRDGVCVDTAMAKVIVQEIGMEDIIGAETICQYSKFEYSTPVNSDLNYFWRVFHAEKVNASMHLCEARFDTLGTATLRLIVENRITGCMDSTDFEVEVMPQPVAEIESEDIVCEYSEITITTPMPDFEVNNSWTISNGDIVEENDSTLVVKTGKKGILIVGLKTENSDQTCSDSTTKTISVFKPIAPEILGIEGDICINELLEVYTKPLVEYNFQWSAAVSEIEYQENERCGFRFLESGTHEIRMILEHKESGCTDTSYASVTVLPGPPLPKVEGSMEVCRGTEYQYKSEFDNSIKYKWFAKDGIIIGEDDKFVVDVKWTGDNPQLDLVVEDPSTSCTSTASYLIDYYPTPDVDIKGIFYICDFEKEYRYDILSDSGYEVDLNVTGGTIVSQTTSTFTVSWSEEVDYHSIDIEFEDANYGCSYHYNYPISTSANEIYKIIGNDTLCYNQSYNYKISIDDQVSEINWYFGGEYIGNKTIQNLSLMQSGILKAEITFNNNCIAEIEKALTLNPQSGIITIDGPNESCVDCREIYEINTLPNDFDFSYEVSGGYVYTEHGNKIEIVWDNAPGGSLTVNSDFSNSACPTSSEMYISVSEEAILDFNLPESICQNDTLLLKTGHLNYDVMWKSENGIITNPKAHTSLIYWQNAGSDKITLIKESKDGSFKDSISKQILVHPIPDIPIISADGQNASSSSCEGNCTFQWYYEDMPIADANSPTLVMIDDGYYKVEHISDNGCSSVSEPYLYEGTGVNENYISENFNLMPNPNTGSFVLKSDVKIKNIEIYNSIGLLVFSKDFDNHSHECKISNSQFVSGMYYISINGGIYRTTFIVKK